MIFKILQRHFYFDLAHVNGWFVFQKAFELSSFLLVTFRVTVYIIL